MLKKLLCLALLVCGWSSTVSAYPADPYALINEAASKTFERLNKDQAQIHSEPGHLRVIIRDELMPYVDNKFAAYKVIGSNIRDTTPQQRERFTQAFTNYIIATYADALAKYDEQKIKVEAAKPLGGEKIVSINVAVLDPGRGWRCGGGARGLVRGRVHLSRNEAMRFSRVRRSSSGACGP